MSQDSSQDSTLGAENELALVRLRRALRTLEGFQLVFLECPEGPERAHVLEELMSWSGVDGTPRLKHLRLSGRAAKLPPLATRNGGIVLEGLDSLLLDNEHVDHLIGTLNWQRDQLKTRIHGPLVLVLSGRGMARLLERAPDLASWRAHTCRITRARPHDPVSNLLEATIPDELELDQLETLLARARDRGNAPPSSLAALWFDVGLARKRSGDRDQARLAFETARSTATHSTDLQARIDLQLGVLEREAGDLVAAQRALDRLEAASANDSSMRRLWLALAMTLADARGDHDLALTIGRELFELSLEDAEMRAAAIAMLSGALANAGRLDEACDLLERLPPDAPPELQLQAHYLKYRLEYDRGRVDLCLEAGKRGLALVRTYEELRAPALELGVRTAALLMTTGQVGEAKEVLDLLEPMAPSADPEFGGLALLLRGALLWAAGKHKQAQAKYKAATTLLAGTDAEPLAKLVMAFVSTGDKARTEFATALRLARRQGPSPVSEIIERVAAAVEGTYGELLAPSPQPRRRGTKPKPRRMPTVKSVTHQAPRHKRGA